MRTGRMRWLSVVGVALVACNGGSGRSSSDTRPPGTKLVDGLVVAAGSRLVGPVFTYPEAPGMPHEFQSTAVLVVDRDPIRVYDEYADQARTLGVPLPTSGATDTFGGPSSFGTCSAAVHDEIGSHDVAVDAADPAETKWVHCYGSGNLPGDAGAMRVESAWGGPSHHAVVDVVDTPATGPSPFRGSARARPFTPLPEMTDRSSASKPGTYFGEAVNAFNSGQRRFRLAPASRVVADFTYTTNQLMVVLRVEGDAAEVMADYARQLGRGGRTPKVRKVSTPKGSILMVDNGPVGGGGATLVTDPSRRWILVRGSSD